MPEDSKRFLHISFAWEGEDRETEISGIFDLAIDWIRYAPNCWIVWTSSNPEKWYKRLKPLVPEVSKFLIIEVSVSESPETYTGWQEDWVWEWFRKDRSNE